MIYILLMIVVILFGVDFYRWQSLIRPNIFFLASFILACSIMVLNQRNWDLALSSQFLLYCLTAIASFYLGTLAVDHYQSKREVKIRIPSDDKLTLMAQPSKLMMSVSIVAVCLYIIIVFSRIDLSFNISDMLRQIYDQNVARNGSNTFFANQLVKIMTAIANISLFQLLLDKYVVKANHRAYPHYISISVFIIMVLISTDRNILIRYVIYALVVWILFISATNVKKDMRNQLKILGKIGLFVLVAVGFFYLFGKMKGYQSNFIRSMSLYGGSGLNNFNIYLNESFPTQLQWGAVTFRSFLGILGRLGIDSLVYKGDVFSEFISYQSSTGFIYESNIYSAMRPFVEDFAYFGVILFPLIMGLFFEYMYRLVERNRYTFMWIFYGLTVYSLAYFTILEQFFNRLHLGFLYEISWAFIFYYFIQQRTKLKEKINEWK